jgi:hypothetical protein
LKLLQCREITYGLISIVYTSILKHTHK